MSCKVRQVCRGAHPVPLLEPAVLPTAQWCASRLKLVTVRLLTLVIFQKSLSHSVVPSHRAGSLPPKISERTMARSSVSSDMRSPSKSSKDAWTSGLGTLENTRTKGVQNHRLQRLPAAPSGPGTIHPETLQMCTDWLRSPYNLYIHIYLRREGTKTSLCAKGGALRVSLAFPGMAAFFRLRSGACWRVVWRKSSWKW